MTAWAGVAVLLAVLLVVQTVVFALYCRWLTKVVIARHAPDLVALERKPPKHPKPPQEPARQPTRPWEMAD